VEVLALRDTTRTVAAEGSLPLGAADVDRLVPDEFDLVLRGRYGMRPTLRHLWIGREVEAMQRVLGTVRSRALRVLDELGPALRLDETRGHTAVANHLIESCREHCAFVASCQSAACASGAPIVLGEAMEEAVGRVGTLPRLAALLDGAEPPRTDDDRRILRAFRDAHHYTDREVRRAG
jgi:hypothetical protein